MNDLRAGAPLSYEALLRYARDVVTLVDVDGVVRYANAAVASMLGDGPLHQVGQRSHSVVHPEDLDYARETREQLLASPGRTTTTVMRVLAQDGWRHVETVGVNLLDDPEVEGLLYVTRDVEDRVREQAELRRAVAGQQLVARLALRALGDRDAAGVTAATLREVAELLGTSGVALTLQDGSTLSHGTIDGTADVVPVALGSRAIGSLAVAAREIPYGGADRELLCSVADVLAGAWARAQDERQAVERALHDPLTGLATRPLLRDRLERALAAPRRSHALLLVDLDHFKQVNDRFGHAAGDEVLRQIGPRLLACVRPTDTVARYGGDEFVVVCEDVEDDVVEAVVARVRQACAEPFALPGGEVVQLSGSIGVAWTRGGGSTADELLQQADAQMYADKRGAGTP